MRKNVKVALAFVFALCAGLLAVPAALAAPSALAGYDAPAAVAVQDATQVASAGADGRGKFVAAESSPGASGSLATAASGLPAAAVVSGSPAAAATPASAASTAAAPATQLLAQADSAVRELPDEPYLHCIWASPTSNTLYYLTYSSGVRKLDVDTGAVSTVSDYWGTCCWHEGDTLYYVPGGGWGASDSYDFTVYRIDLTSGDEAAYLEVTGSAFYPSTLGVDPAGRVYVASSGGMSVYAPDGALVATTSESLGINEFFGFDVSNGNFYYEGFSNWVYWGYDHNMDALKIGRVANGAITYNENAVTLFNQFEYRQHFGYGTMLDSRYLAVLSPFNGDYLYLVDSAKVSPDVVGEVQTTILFTGGYDTTDLALPAGSCAFYTETRAGAYEGDYTYVDQATVGIRAAYSEKLDRLLVATDEREISSYNVATGEAEGTVAAANSIYAVFATQDALVLLEKDEQGAFHVESMLLTYPTSMGLAAPQRMTVGEGGECSVSMDGSIRQNVSFSSSDPEVASVDASGHVSAWKAGRATITAKAETGLSATADVTVEARASTPTRPAVTELAGAKANNLNFNDYTTYGSPVTSYLVEADDGLMRVQENGGSLLVEYYDGAGALASSRTVELELPLFGGFFAGEDAYYVVSGQTNAAESDDVVVLAATRYDFDWKRLGACEVKAANTRAPFDAGSCRMAEVGGALYVHTCHTMYASDDGLNHQANMTFKIDEASMALLDSYTSVMNLSEGYVSHSFNQFIRTDGETVFRVDHGDAYPRGIAFTGTSVDSALSQPYGTATAATFAGDTGRNYTGASVGGFELSRSCGIIAWNEDVSTDASSWDIWRNVKLTVVDVYDTGAIETKQVTSYTAEDKVNCYTPQLVKLADDHFLLMWTEERETGTDSDGNAKTARVTKMAHLDAAGNVVGEPVEKTVPLSDCQPIVLSDGSVAWFASTDSFAKLYVLDPYDLAGMADDVMGNAAIEDDAPADGEYYRYDEDGNVVWYDADGNVVGGSQAVAGAKAKKANTLKAKAKLVKVKASTLKKKTVKVARKKAFTVKAAKGKVTYKVAKYDKKAKKKITVSKAGKVTVKKGLARGLYKLKVKVRAAGNASYKAKTRTVTLKVRVK